ncbi:MAG: helix-turn-helix domain-containing protein [Turicibacter sanguinis]
MNNIEVKDIIKKRRLKLGLSYSELGKMCGVDKTTVRKWELGLIENMKRDKMVLLSQALGVSPLILLGVEKEFLEDNLNMNDTDKINVYSHLFAHKIENPIDKINNPYPHQTGDFFALVIDNIKINNLLDDTKVYAIFKKQSLVENGTIVAVSIANDSAIIKKFYKMDDIIVLRSTTNESDQPITIVGNDVKDVNILGQLVGVVSPFINQ